MNADAHELTPVSTLNQRNSTADRAYKLNLGMQFINKQRIPDLNGITFFYNHFGFQSAEVVRYKCVLSGATGADSLLSGFAFQVDVQAFT